MQELIWRRIYKERIKRDRKREGMCSRKRINKRPGKNQEYRRKLKKSKSEKEQEYKKHIGLQQT
jgi:hypothetical protein